MIDRVRILSDLHLEFAGFLIPPLPEDETTVLILAGDVSVDSGAAAFIHLQCRRFAKVVYVLGNHEHYHGDFQETKNKLLKALAQFDLSDLVIVVDDATKIEFDGFRILAGTLWTDMNNNDVLTHSTVGSHLYDFRVVKNGGKDTKFTTEDAVIEFVSTVQRFTKWLEEPYTGQTFIATHHLPSDSAVDPQFADSYHMNGGFRSNLDDFIKKYSPDVWFFGHTHSSCDIMLHQTRLVCNPRGYPRRNGSHENTEFNPTLTIKLD